MTKVGIIFGGKSGEHEVSLVSAESIIKHLPKDAYTAIPIGITKDGKWVSDNDPMKQLKSASIMYSEALPPKILREVDIVFPVLHGPFGEDGKIQGLFEMMNIPYVGADSLASALGMDKVISKSLWQHAGLPVVSWGVFTRKVFVNEPEVISKFIADRFGYPCFVKPANLGSSLGVSKMKNESQLHKGLEEAFSFDYNVIVEKAVNGREIEIGVIGNFEDIRASLPGEVLVAGEFYDFYDKYVNGKSTTKIVDDFSLEQIAEVQGLAIRAFKAIKGSGLARVDLFMDRNNGKFYLNEINTMPGFTSISMFPKVWQASGLSYGDLLDTVIQLGLEYFKERSKNRTTFESGSDWYR